MTREGTAAPAQSAARQITPLTVNAESAQLGATAPPASSWELLMRSPRSGVVVGIGVVMGTCMS